MPKKQHKFSGVPAAITLLCIAGCASPPPPPPDPNICLAACYQRYQTVLRECEIFHAQEKQLTLKDERMARCIAKGGFSAGTKACSASCGIER